MILALLFALAPSCAHTSGDITACASLPDAGDHYTVTIRRGKKVIYTGEREWVTFGYPEIQVFRRDLDGDGRKEIIAADFAGMSNGMMVEYWYLTIIDGRSGGANITALNDYGPDLIRGRTVFITSWEWIGDHLYFVARPHVWSHGALRPDKKSGMLQRRYLFSFERERDGGRATPGQWLKKAQHVPWR